MKTFIIVFIIIWSVLVSLWTIVYNYVKHEKTDRMEYFKGIFATIIIAIAPSYHLSELILKLNFLEHNQ